MSARERRLFMHYATRKGCPCDAYCSWYHYDSGHFPDDSNRSDWMEERPIREIAESLSMDGLT